MATAPTPIDPLDATTDNPHPSDTHANVSVEQTAKYDVAKVNVTAAALGAPMAAAIPTNLGTPNNTPVVEGGGGSVAQGGGGAPILSLLNPTEPQNLAANPTNGMGVAAPFALASAPIGQTPFGTPIIPETPQTPTLTLGISDATPVLEGAALQYTVSISGGVSDTPMLIPLTYAGTATPVLDYAGQPIVVMIPAGQTSATVIVPTLVDNIIEGPESVIISLGTPIGSSVPTTISQDHGTGIINDGTVGKLALTGPASVNEGDLTTNYTVSLDGVVLGAGQSVTFTLDTSSGTATEGSDFQALLSGGLHGASGISLSGFSVAANGAITVTATNTTTSDFASGSPLLNFQVATITDTTVEGPENFNVVLSSSTATITTPLVVTTINDTGPHLSVAISDAAPVNEGGNLIYTVNLLGGTSTSDITVPLTYSGTATPVLDYNGQPITVTILANQTSATVTVPTLVDNIVEGPETVVVNLGTPSNPSVSVLVPQGTGIINDTGDTQPHLTVSIGNAGTVTEGGDLQYTVTLSGGTSATAIDIPLTYSGTATPVLDYNGQPVIVTIPPNQTSATITVHTIDDNIVENPETVLVTLGTPSNPAVTVVIPTGTGIILDNDGPGLDTATWSITGTTSVNEGQNATYLVHLDGTMQAGETALIHLALADITTTPADYTNFIQAVQNGVAANPNLSFDASTGTLTFTSNGSPMSDLMITLGAVNDTIVEGPEQYQINLSNPSSTTGSNVLGSGNVVTTINDTGTHLSVAISDAAPVNEGGNLIYTVNLLGGTSTSDITVPLTYSGTATPILDYNGQPITVTILANQTSATVTVPALMDNIVENPETVLVNLGTPSDPSVSVLVPQGTGIINDVQSHQLTVSISDAGTVVEGGNLQYTVTLSGGTSPTDITIPLTYAGTATPILDYNGQAITVTILANKTSATVTVPTLDDNIVENPETVLVTLGSPSNPAVIVVVPTGTGIITDNDGPGLDTATWSITGSTSVNEGANATYLVHLDGTMQAGETALIHLDLADISTTSADYTNFIQAVQNAVALNPNLSFDAGTGTLTFTSNGSPMADLMITLGAVNDTIVEGPEQYNISLSNPGSTTGANVLGSGSVVTTINDTGTHLSVVISDAPTVNEGGVLVYTVNLIGGTSTSDITIPLTYSGTAIPFLDYNGQPLSVTILAGSTSAIVPVQSLMDQIQENPETVIVTLGNPSDPSVDVIVPQGTGIINDLSNTHPPLTVSISDAGSVSEGLTLTYNVTLSGGTSPTNIVIPLTYAGTAMPVLDYSGQPIFVTILANQTSATVNVPTLVDNLVENPETVLVTLGTPNNPNVSVLVPTGTGIILDSNGSGLDTATWFISGSVSVNEGQTAHYTIHLDGTMQAGETANIHLELTDMTTTSADYTNFINAVNAAVAADSHLSFDAGTGTLTFTSTGAPMSDLNINLGAVMDGVTESPEKYNISLSNPGSTTGANVLGTGTVITTINDGTIAPRTVYEDALVGGNGGAGENVIQVTYTYDELLSLVNANSAVDFSLNSSITGSTGLTQDGHNIVWHYDIGSGSIQGIDSVDSSLVFTITQDPFDNLIFTLNGKIDNGTGDANNTNFALNGVLIAKDAFSNPVTVMNGLTVNINNDVPQNNNTVITAQTVYEDALTAATNGVSGNGGAGETVNSVTYTAASLATLVSPGADGPVTFSLNTAISGSTGLSQDGHVINWSYDPAGGGTIKGVDSVDSSVVFTLTQTVNGNLTFTLLGHIDHNNASGDTGANSFKSLDIGKALIATDTDGDQVVVDNGLVVNINNDVPEKSGITLSDKVVYEDALNNANAQGNGGAGENVVSVTYDMSAAVKAGADAPLTYGFDTTITGSTGLTQNGVAINWQYDAVSGDYNGVIGSNVIFTVSKPVGSNVTFTLKDNIDNGTGDGNNTSLNIGKLLIATDTDGDKLNLDNAILVKINNDVPQNNNTVITAQTVYEDALTAATNGVSGNGGAGETVNSVTYTAASLATLVSPGADGPVTFSLNTAISGSTGLSQDGHVINWSYDPAGGGTIKGVDSVDSSVVFTLTQTVNGNLTFTLLGHIDHNNASGDTGANSFKSLDIGKALIATDTDGDQVVVDNGLVVNINNDVPLAVNDTVTNTSGSTEGKVDIQFIIDVSGSMSTAVSNVPNYDDTRLGLARYSMEQFLNAHPEILNVEFVKFSSTASNTVWMTRAQAITYIQNGTLPNGTTDPWVANGGTDYDLALTRAMSAYTASSRPIAGANQTLVYFMSDGEPNAPSSDPGITNNGSGANVSISEWETFINNTKTDASTTNDISDVFAIGLGSAASGGTPIAQLNPIAYPPHSDNNTTSTREDHVIVVSNSNTTELLASLNASLQSVITPSTGNVLTNDSPGADNYGTPAILSATFGADTYVFANAADSHSFNLGTDRGTLVMKGDGSYTYTPVAGPIYVTPLNVSYTIKDADGDTSTGTLILKQTGGPAGESLIGSIGADTYTGGGGADKFIFLKGDGTGATDTITDFVQGTDTIVIQGTNINTVTITSNVSGGNTTYHFTVTYTGGAPNDVFNVLLSNGATLLNNGTVINSSSATIDGTIVGATLYLDINHNSQEDAGEHLGVTDQQGHVEWTIPLASLDINGDGFFTLGEARAVQTGGFDIHTGLTYNINLYGQVGAEIVSPLTSLLQVQLEAGVSLNSANASISQHLGLPPGSDLTVLNPIESTNMVLEQNAAVMTAAIQFSELEASKFGMTPAQASFAVFQAINGALSDLASNQIADFTDPAFLQSIAHHLGLQNGDIPPDVMQFMLASQDALHASIASLPAGASSADALAAISAVQHITQANYDFSAHNLGDATHQLLNYIHDNNAEVNHVGGAHPHMEATLDFGALHVDQFHSTGADADGMLMHISGLPTGVHASLNFGTLNADGSYTLSQHDLNHLGDLKLSADKLDNTSQATQEAHATNILKADISINEGSSVSHTYADIHYSIVEHPV